MEEELIQNKFRNGLTDQPNSITPVYVEAAENVEVDVDWLYCLIPAQYAFVYHKLLLAMADLGIDMLQDCKSSCKDSNKRLIDCFTMFNSAVACYKLGREKEAKLLMDYIEGQLHILYGGTAKEEPNIIVKVGEHNEYEAFVSRDKSTNKLVFKMNPETAKQYNAEPNPLNRVYEDEELI